MGFYHHNCIRKQALLLVICSFRSLCSCWRSASPLVLQKECVGISWSKSTSVILPMLLAICWQSSWMTKQMSLHLLIFCWPQYSKSSVDTGHARTTCKCLSLQVPQIAELAEASFDAHLLAWLFLFLQLALALRVVWERFFGTWKHSILHADAWCSCLAGPIVCQMHIMCNYHSMWQSLVFSDTTQYHLDTLKMLVICILFNHVC